MYLVIDIGGTKTLIAVFSKRGRVLRRVRFETPLKKSDFLSQLLLSLEPLSKKYRSKILSVTIAVPGMVQKNQILWLGNRPWHDLNLEKCIKKLFNVPIFIKNDADLATVFESSFYPEKSLYLTFSTGIGGGLASLGSLDKTSAKFEPGHTKYQFQGKLTEWEDIAAASAIRTTYGRKVTDIKDKSTLQDIANRITIGLVPLIKQFKPNTIIFGGPLSIIFKKYKKPLLTNLRTELNTTDLPLLTKAKRPTESVIYGGYLYGKQHTT